MKLKYLTGKAASWAAAFFLLVPLVSAQTGTGAITGTVVDATGAAIPSVNLRLINEESGANLATLTNEAGQYRFTSLPPGNFRIEAEKDGFDRLRRAGLNVTVSQTLAIDLTMTVGSAAETLTVEASSPVTESQSSSSGQLINRRMVQALPMPNRAATALVALAPGVVMINTGQGAENYPVFAVAGGRPRNQNFTLDGGNVTNAVGVTRPQQMTSLPMDAMQEFRVISNSYGAEYGHSTGGIITLSTRSGTNQFHGSVFEFLRNNALDARNFFAATKPALRLNQYGGTLGGPIQKDKTHFFASWEQTKQVSNATVFSTVPSLAQRQGDFSGLVDSKGNQIKIYDPATTSGNVRQQFPGNKIPLSRFDSVAAASLAYWPTPNAPGTLTGANNYLANETLPLDRNIGVIRVDHQLSQKDSITGRYYINDSFVTNSGSYGIPVADPDADRQDVRIQSLMGSHTHVFSPSVVNDFRFSFLQRKFIDTRPGSGENLASKIGLTGVSDQAFPTFNVTGYSMLGAAQVARIQTPIRDYQYLESLTWIHGRHAVKFGFEHRRGQNVEIRDRSSAGTFAFSPLNTGLPGNTSTGNALASFLLGNVNTAQAVVSDQIHSRAYYVAGYVQDDWRVTDRLTLNYGVRWETELPRRVDGDLQNSFDLYKINPVSGTPGVVTFSGRDGVPRQAFNTDWNNWGPRFGFAYRLPFARETVIRGGAGTFYASTVSNTIGDAATNGFSTNISLAAAKPGFNTALQLQNGMPVIPRPALNDSFGAVPVGTKPTTSVAFFERNRPTPLSYQYNLNVQREIAPDTVLEVGYMANISHHITSGADLSLNQVAPSLMGASANQSLRPYPQFTNVSIINPAIGDSTYHSGYIRAERRFRGGYSFLAHYTFSKFLDNVAAADEYGDSTNYMDLYNRRLDKGRSGSDIPHRLVLSGLYEVPKFREKGWMNVAVTGWKLGAFLTMQSGEPFSVVMASDTTNAFPAGSLRPNLLRDPALSSGQSIAQWFDTSAFAAPAPYTFGNSPRSVYRAPSLKTLDMTAAKEFAVTERFHTELRGEFYNSLNHANFGLPGRVLGAQDFGVIKTANAGRTVQLGLRVSF